MSAEDGENFLIIEAGEVFIQLASEFGDADYLWEAVGQTNLPQERQLSQEQERRLVKEYGFNMPREGESSSSGNYWRNYTVATASDAADLGELIPQVMDVIYGADPKARVRVELIRGEDEGHLPSLAITREVDGGIVRSLDVNITSDGDLRLEGGDANQTVKEPSVGSAYQYGWTLKREHTPLLFGLLEAEAPQNWQAGLAEVALKNGADDPDDAWALAYLAANRFTPDDEFLEWLETNGVESDLFNWSGATITYKALRDDEGGVDALFRMIETEEELSHEVYDWQTKTWHESAFATDVFSGYNGGPDEEVTPAEARAVVEAGGGTYSRATMAAPTRKSPLRRRGRSSRR
ncbi:MAG: hypothetical protein WEB00_07350, partial [Dehalococcoidia bacterium]